MLYLSPKQLRPRLTLDDRLAVALAARKLPLRVFRSESLGRIKDQIEHKLSCSEVRFIHGRRYSVTIEKVFPFTRQHGTRLGYDG